MRMRRTLMASLTVAGVAAVVALAALVPVWATASAGSAVEEVDGYVIPGELTEPLVEKCQGFIPVAVDQTVFPSWYGAEGDERLHLRMEVWQIDAPSGSMNPAEPTAEQAARLGEANACLASYSIDDWAQPPQFDAFHRNMYYEYVAGALVPCLVARGIDAEIPPRQAFKNFDASTWYYQNHIAGLDFDEALRTWRACPPVPEYLLVASRPRDPDVTIFQP